MDIVPLYLSKTIRERDHLQVGAYEGNHKPVIVTVKGKHGGARPGAGRPPGIQGEWIPNQELLKLVS